MLKSLRGPKPVETTTKTAALPPACRSGFTVSYPSHCWSASVRLATIGGESLHLLLLTLCNAEEASSFCRLLLLLLTVDNKFTWQHVSAEI